MSEHPKEIVERIRDYFDQRADAEAVGDPARYQGNEAMHRMMDCDTLTSSLSAMESQLAALTQQRDEALAMVEKLREALREARALLTCTATFDQNASAEWMRGRVRAVGIADSLLAITPSRALAEHDARVIEKCAAEFDFRGNPANGPDQWYGHEVAAHLRALAAPKEADRG